MLSRPGAARFLIRVVATTTSLIVSHYYGCNSLSSKVTSCSVRSHYVGFDLGTSGIRISIVEPALSEDNGSTSLSSSSLSSSRKPMMMTTLKEIHNHVIPWKENAFDDPNTWIESVRYLLEHAKNTTTTTLDHVRSICVSGTSASCLLIDGKNNVGKPSRSPPSRMYNYNVISSSVDPIHGVRA